MQLCHVTGVSNPDRTPGAQDAEVSYDLVERYLLRGPIVMQEMCVHLLFYLRLLWFFQEPSDFLPKFVEAWSDAAFG